VPLKRFFLFPPRLDRRGGEPLRGTLSAVVNRALLKPRNLCTATPLSLSENLSSPMKLEKRKKKQKRYKMRGIIGRSENKNKKDEMKSRQPGVGGGFISVLVEVAMYR
jgi:hypothetical protein